MFNVLYKLIDCDSSTKVGFKFAKKSEDRLDDFYKGIERTMGVAVFPLFAGF